MFSSCFFTQGTFLSVAISFLALIYISLVVLESQWNNSGAHRSSLLHQDCCFPMSALVSNKMGNFVSDSKLSSVV
ncbi:hypothetical protein V6N13_028062 [Hibiscus sabdariffa]